MAMSAARRRRRELERRAEAARQRRRVEAREQKIDAFARRLEAMRDACRLLGIATSVHNGGLHFQFRCDELLGNYYPTTNRLFLQEPRLSPTLHAVRHRDALVAFLRVARQVVGLRELYRDPWLASGQPVPRVDRSAGDAIARLHEELIRLAAHRPRLLERIAPRELEHLTAELLRHDGWSATVTRASADGGRDVIALRDEAGREVVLLAECKRWRRPVGIDVIHRAVGVRYLERADQMMVVTISRFTAPARRAAERLPDSLSLVDGAALQQWMRRYDRRREEDERAALNREAPPRRGFSVAGL
jgi:restriction endonuclease